MVACGLLPVRHCISISLPRAEIRHKGGPHDSRCKPLILLPVYLAVYFAIPQHIDSLVRHKAFPSSTLLAESRSAPVCELNEALHLSVNGHVHQPFDQDQALYRFRSIWCVDKRRRC